MRVDVGDRTCLWCPSIRPYKHSILYRPPDPFFCVNNNTAANHGQTEWRMLEKDSTSSLSHVRVPTLPVDRARQGWRGRKRDGEGWRGRESYPLPHPFPLLLLPLHPHHTGTSKTITHPSPQLKVVLHQWLRFLHSILRKGQNRQRASCKAAPNKTHSLYHTTCRLQHIVYSKWLTPILH